MNNLVLFEERQVRRIWIEADQKWYFSIVDVVGVLTDSVNAGAYWRKLKERLKKEGNETVTNCHGFKMRAADGKQRLTDAADTEPFNGTSDRVVALSKMIWSKIIMQNKRESFCS